MTGYTLTQPETWYAGPIAYQAAGNATTGWVQAASGSTGQQSLVTGATGASGAAGFTQPYFPAGFWSRAGQHAVIKAHGTVSWPVTTSQTITWAFGTSGSTPQGTATTITATNTFITSLAYPSQGVAQTNIPWHFELDMQCTKIGVGVTAVSTAIQTTGVGGFTPAVVGPVGAIPAYGPLPGNVITTFDSTVNQFMWASVAFGTGVSCNCTMTSFYIYGMN